MKTLFSLLIAFGALICLSFDQAIAQNAPSYDQLKEGFKSPPPGARPKVYFWWLNGNVDTVRVKEEIAAMDRGGISGFDIFEIGVRQTDDMVAPGPAFLSDESLKSIRVALLEAKKRNMDVGLNLASSWNAGGAWTTPENSAKSIYFSSLDVKGKSGGTVKLPFPEVPAKDARGRAKAIEFQKNGRPVFYAEVAVVGIPMENGQPVWDPAKFVDLTSKFDAKSDKLTWDLSGDWLVHRYICSNSGEQLKLPSKNSVGPIIDHFDAQATEAHFLYIIGRIQQAMGDDLSKTALKSLYLASYEATGFVWTTTLPLVFKELNGYEVNKYLPVLFNEENFSEEVVSKFKKDRQRTLSELMINNFYKKAKEISNKYGLKINSESGGPGLPLHNVPVEPLKSLGALDLPRGEYWIHHDRFNEHGIDILRMVKEVSAASHIYGRGIVEEEAFTSFKHWQEGPFDMKPSGDRAFAEGMNRVVVHGFSHNPAGYGYPGIVYHAGTHFNDRRVWFSKVRPFNDYLGRISFVLQQTDFFADVLYYYGDAIPNYAGHKNSRFMVAPGYDYELTNTEILLQASVKNGKVVLPTGAAFSVLALEDEGEINPQVLQKIDELVRAGARVTGAKPKKVSDIPGRTEAMNATLNKLWGAGSQRVLNQQPVTVLGTLGLGPDIDYVDRTANTLDYIHYNKAGLDFYFVRNTTDQWVSREIGFRQQGKVPEIWDPVSGSVLPVTIYQQDGSYIRLPLSLAPYGSAFITFKQGKSTAKFEQLNSRGLFPPLLDYTAKGILVMEDGIFEATKAGQSTPVTNITKHQPISGAWEVFFSQEWGGPERIIYPELVSWTESDIEGVKYYSGNAKYKKTFQYDINASSMKNQRVLLDLGDLSKIGEVWLNGTSLGIAWAKPYRFDVTDVLKPADNVLEIEIANTWSNRITGDALTEGKDYTFTNVEITDIFGLNKIKTPWVDVPLIKSGLLGPVQLITVSPIE
ncbi:MAG: glycosyl hydrolase [Imperialibacter sp.]|uniref:glycosyl hydrolase n=1 Tax=Imperialibacter sp. TaxID=2038411 RepID=UPI0032F04278